MALVDDADRDEQLAGADVEAPVEQEVEVRLFQLEFALVVAAFDDGVLDLELGDEADAIGEPVGEEQDEAAEVDDRVGVGRVDELEVHVPRQRRDGAAGRAIGRIGRLGFSDSRGETEDQGRRSEEPNHGGQRS